MWGWLDGEPPCYPLCSPGCTGESAMHWLELGAAVILVAFAFRQGMK
jgi:hypothetical protein